MQKNIFPTHGYCYNRERSFPCEPGWRLEIKGKTYPKGKFILDDGSVGHPRFSGMSKIYTSPWYLPAIQKGRETLEIPTQESWKGRGDRPACLARDTRGWRKESSYTIEHLLLCAHASYCSGKSLSGTGTKSPQSRVEHPHAMDEDEGKSRNCCGWISTKEVRYGERWNDWGCQTIIVIATWYGNTTCTFVWGKVPSKNSLWQLPYYQRTGQSNLFSRAKGRKSVCAQVSLMRNHSVWNTIVVSFERKTRKLFPLFHLHLFGWA